MPEHPGGARECAAEELVVEFDDQVLTGLWVGDAARAAAHGSIETLQFLCLAAPTCASSITDSTLVHRLRDRIAFDERMPFEHGIKHRAGDQVLRQHLDGVVGGDGLVQVIADLFKEVLKKPCASLPSVLDKAFGSG